MQQWDVFISYASEDRAIMERVRSDFMRHGLRCWIDKDRIDAGDNWRARIREGIRQSRLVVLLYSEHSNDSKWVRREICEADDQDMDILVLRMSTVDYNDSIAMILGGTQYKRASYPPTEDEVKQFREQVMKRLGLSEAAIIAELRSENAQLRKENAELKRRIQELESLPRGAVSKPKGTLRKERFHRWIENPRTVQEIFILDTVDCAPEDAEDLSEERNRSVLGWMAGNALYLAGDGGIYAPEDSAFLFSDIRYSDTKKWKNLKRISNAGRLDTSRVTNMEGMFAGCTALTPLDVSRWDTSRVTDMRGMFWGCTALTTLDVSGWDTSHVTDIYRMFYKCAALTTLDVSGWDTSCVTNMHGMFYRCTALTTLNVSRWDISSLKERDRMFYGTRWADNPPYPFNK